MKGMGTYTPLEVELGNYNIDEMNEMYMSGELDTMYDDFERTKVIPVKRKKKKYKNGEQSQ